MTRILLAAGVAALAITTPAASQPDKGGGKDRASQAQNGDRGKARAQRSERRQAAQQRSNAGEKRSNAREQRAQRSNAREQRAERGQASERRAQAEDRRGQRAERSNKAEQRASAKRGNEARQQARADRPERVREQRADRVERVRDQRAQAQRMDRRNNGGERRAERQNRQIERIAERRGFQLERNGIRGERQLARLAERNVIRTSDWDDLARNGVWLNGCPPGLAKKLVGCVPPGQVKNLVGQPLSTLRDRVTLRELPSRLRVIYSDTDDYYYRYGNGYAYRVNRSNDLVSALLPLFGLGLTTGQMFPSAYSNYHMPTSLQAFYPNYSNASYRYANGYVYQVNPMTGLIENVDPLLGYGYGYGQMMPATYSAYNVPYQYRSMYYDTPDHYYRYAPGAIYQVDPQTSLITGIAALLTGGMTVGQQLPTGYGVYNVPYQYRSSYRDTPDSWYRYANGNVYQVDPTTRLVTAIVASLLT